MNRALTPQYLYPSLYQIDTRAGLRDLSQNLGRPATLDDIADQELDRLAERGFDWIWYLGVWQTGPAGRKVSRDHLEWQAEFRQVLPDFQQADISGSCFALTGYTVHSDFGGNPALERLRQRIHQRGMRLMLDFVPNHTAPDHPWTRHIPNSMSGVRKRSCARSRKITLASKLREDPWCWPMAGIPTFPDGPTRCS